MKAYLQRRILFALIALAGVTVVVSAMLHISGDPVAVMLQSGIASQAEREALRRELGFDKPFVLQYVDFVRGAVPRRSRAVPAIPPAGARRSSASGCRRRCSWRRRRWRFAIVVAVPVGVLSAARPALAFSTTPAGS